MCFGEIKFYFQFRRLADSAIHSINFLLIITSRWQWSYRHLLKLTLIGWPADHTNYIANSLLLRMFVRPLREELQMKNLPGSSLHSHKKDQDWSPIRFLNSGLWMQYYRLFCQEFRKTQMEAVGFVVKIVFYPKELKERDCSERFYHAFPRWMEVFLSRTTPDAPNNLMRHSSA